MQRCVHCLRPVDRRSWPFLQKSITLSPSHFVCTCQTEVFDFPLTLAWMSGLSLCCQDDLWMVRELQIPSLSNMKIRCITPKKKRWGSCRTWFIPLPLFRRLQCIVVALLQAKNKCIMGGWTESCIIFFLVYLTWIYLIRICINTSLYSSGQPSKQLNMGRLLLYLR